MHVYINVVFIDELWTMSETVSGSDASKWELAMQEEYESLVAKGIWELAPLPKEQECGMQASVSH